MLRKIILLITIVMVVTLMGSCENKDINPEPKGEYKAIIAKDYNLKRKSGDGAIIQNYVDDAITAQLIADAVIQSIVGEEKFEKLIGVTVSYDEQKGIWIINRNLGSTTLGGDYTCAIRRSNGEVLKVWAGE